MQSKKLISALVVASSLAVVTTTLAGAQTAAKAGGACQRRQVGRNVGTLICTREGSKYVWREAKVTAVTAAPVASTPAAEASLSGQEISFIHWRSEDKAVFDELIADFTKETGIKVKSNIYPSNDYQSNAINLIKDGELGDVFTAFRGAQFFQIARAGLYTDLSNQGFVKNYNANLVEPGRFDGKQLGLPYQLVFNMPIYNVDLLKRLNLTPPSNINDLQRFCVALKGKGITPIAWPGGEAANAGQLSMNGFIMNNAPSDDIFGKIDTGQAKVTEFWFTRTLQQFKDLADDCFQDNPLGTNTNGAIALFAQEKAAMLATGTFHMGSALALNPNLTFGLYVPLTNATGTAPKYEGIYNATFILGVNAKSKKQAAALKFVEFLSSKGAAERYANGTNQHSTVAGVAYKTAPLRDTAAWATKRTLLAPRFQFLNLNVRNAVEKAFIDVVGGKKPEVAAAEAQATIDQQLGVR